MGDHRRVQPIGLGQPSGSAGKLAHLARIDHCRDQPCFAQRQPQRPLVPAGRLQHDAFHAQRPQPGDQPGIPGRFITHREAGRVEVWRGGCRSSISVAAPFVWRCLTSSTMLRFHTPLIEPDMRISRIRLSDKTSRLRPRRAAPKLGQTYEPEVPVEVREWIAPALASPDLVLGPQPPAQPHSRVVVERAIGLAGGADTEVVGPPAQHAVQLVYELCGLLPVSRSVGQRMDFSTMRLMLFFDGRKAKRAWPVVREYIRPNG